MQRKPSKLLFLSVGAALAWFLDPVSGSARRRQVTDQLGGVTDKMGPPSDPTGGAAPPFPTAAPPPQFESAVSSTTYPPKDAGSTTPPFTPPVTSPVTTADGVSDDKGALRTSW